VAYARLAWDLLLHSAIEEPAARAARSVLRDLTLCRSLEDARIPVAITTTDLRSGERIVLRAGSAADAAYASSALAGIVPPLARGELLLADGTYTDPAPVDVARGLIHDVVIAVDPGQRAERAAPQNGLELVVRAMEVCHSQHAHLRFDAADFVLRPRFPRMIDTLEFAARRHCVAAGIRAVREQRAALRDLLAAAPLRSGPARALSRIWHPR
jgi:NTE family protein